MKQFVFILTLFFANFISSQENKRVLFIGNSYTSVNNLPQLTKDLSLSAGDTLFIDSHTPGGQTFQGHFGDAIVNSKIAQGNWDFVVLQEQSQRPSFPDSQVEVEVFPFAKKLDSLINLHNPCAETAFYMTWGRKNGDAGNCAFWPPVCTYSGMDSLLYLRYMQMAEENQAIVSPVGKLWHYLRTNHPEIELYSADESHPSLAGSYASACSFYTTIFRKSPLLITNDYGLNSVDALAIRQATELIVFDSLMNWRVGEYDLQANFTFSDAGNGQIQFNNQSNNVTNFSWDFGDNSFSTDPNPMHNFATSGSFIVELIVSNECNFSDTIAKLVNIGISSINVYEAKSSNYFPNPVKDLLTLNFQNTSSYSIFDLNYRYMKEFKTNQLNQIDLSELLPGMYFLKVIDSKLGDRYYQILKE